jgi:hypothetical protein
MLLPHPAQFALQLEKLFDSVSSCLNDLRGLEFVGDGLLVICTRRHHILPLPLRLKSPIDALALRQSLGGRQVAGKGGSEGVGRGRADRGLLAKRDLQKRSVVPWWNATSYRQAHTEKKIP